MRVFIDVDLHQAIADFATRQPAPTYTFKSQDTIDFQIYFVQAGVVQDYGSGFALKFGMIKTGDASNTILAYQTACTYLTDSAGQVYYQMQVVMNTSQMATAIGTNPSIACTIELRYQDSLNEIIHTLNLAAIVYATILVETGVTPPGVSTGYPDASTIELLVHKNAPSGYAGLDSSSHLNGAVIPVDGQTVALNPSGQVSSAAILAYTAANFTTPSSGGTVSVTFGSTANLKAGSYVRIPIAGYYIVQSVTNSTTAVLQNNGDPFNAIAGVTITSGAVVLPAQAAAGGGGTAGQNAYTTLTAGFTVPAAGATVSITVASTAWMPGSGYALFIGGAGYYLVSSITDSTHVVVLNSGSAANQSPGTTVSSGATVTGAGPQGAPGATGASLSAYDALTASFTMPAVSANVAITIANTAWLSANQIIYVASAGYFQVATIINATTLNVTNLNYPGNTTAGTVIASGSKVSPGGLQGPQGAGGAGLNAFTTLSANFTQPAINATVAVNVGTTAWMAVGQQVFIQSGGYYGVSSISDLTHAVVINLGTSGNAAPGATVIGNGTQNVTPAGTPGTGGNAYTTITASFTQPALGTSVTVSMGSSAWLAQNQYVFITGGGLYSVSSILNATQAILISVAATGTVSSGTTVPSGSSVSPAGPPGPAGPQGIQGAPGSLSSLGDSIATAAGAEVSMQTGASAGVGLIKKLKSGPAGSVVLTDNGGSTGDILVDVPVDGTTITVSGGHLVASGGGGGGPILPSARAFDFDDFDNSITANNQPNGKLGWLCKLLASATITSASNQGLNSTDKANGVWSFGGAISGDWQSISLGDFTNTAKNTLVPGLGILTLEFRVGIVALPTGTQDLMIKFGLCAGASSLSTVTPPDGVYFEYWFGNAITNWQFTTVAGGTATNTTTGTAAVAGGYHKFQILTNAGWTSIQALIDGVVKATNTAHIPTNNLCPFMVVGNMSSASWPHNVYIDYFFKDYQYTR